MTLFLFSLQFWKENFHVDRSLYRELKNIFSIYHWTKTENKLYFDLNVNLFDWNN